MNIKTNKTERRYGIANNPEHLPPLTVSQQQVQAARTKLFGTGEEFRPVPITAYIESEWATLFNQF